MKGVRDVDFFIQKYFRIAIARRMELFSEETPVACGHSELCKVPPIRYFWKKKKKKKFFVTEIKHKSKNGFADKFIVYFYSIPNIFVT